MKRDRSYFTDIYCDQRHKTGKYCFGDVFLNRRIKEEGRTLLVLSDGMGSGAKANVLATLTASMSINFNLSKGRLKEVSEIIMDTLPVCSVRRISYSTFTIVEIENDGTTHLVEFDNPKAIVIRRGKLLDLDYEKIVLGGSKHAGRVMTYTNFMPQIGDRVVFWSDGVTQSGTGSKRLPLGWGLKDLTDFVLNIVSSDKDISSRRLSKKVINRAVQNDIFKPKDDISVVSIFYRKPRKLLICTGPPYEKSKDYQFAKEVESFNGERIICGGTTTDILIRELDLKVESEMKVTDRELPPISFIEGFELVTEGVMTLDKVLRLLENFDGEENLQNGPADKIIKHIISNDEIYFLTGSRLNETNFDPSLENEMKIRKYIVERIKEILEEKLIKHVKIKFI